MADQVEVSTDGENDQDDSSAEISVPKRTAAGEAIFCRYCHRKYPLSQIKGVRGPIEELKQNPELLANPQAAKAAGLDVRPWAEVRLPPPVSGAKLVLQRIGIRRKQSEAQVADKLADSYDPYCPQAHFLVDELADRPYFVTVAGNVSASKSTFLVGLVAEVLQSASLGPLPMFASLRPSQTSELRRRTVLVYQENKVLPPTPEESAEKGFIIRGQSPAGERRNLAFVDVSGEVIRDEVKAAKNGRFLYSSNGIILLLDPAGFPDPDGWMSPLEAGTELVTSDIVTVLADGLEQVRQRPVRELKVPIIVTIAKSDKIKDWAFPEPVKSDSRLSVEDRVKLVKSALEVESELVREYLLSHGLEAIVTTAEARFGREMVAYARISALGQGPDEKGSGKVRKPDGCWKPVAQLLIRSEII